MDNKPIGFVFLEAMESNPETVKVISDTEDKRRLVAEGEVQTAEEENRNTRTYLNPDLHREITCPRTVELLAAGMMRGEAGHPLSNDVTRQQTIDPANVCVKYLKFWMDGNHVMAHFRGTNNALGEAFDQDLRDGDKPSFSLRALGTLESIKGRNIVRDLRMITYDCVIYPSHPGAYTHRIVTESAQMSNPNNNGIMLPITNEEIISYIKSESTNLSNVLRQVDTFYESVSVVNNGSNVRLVAKNGDVFIINLESYIQNEIQAYASKYLI